MFFKTDAIVLKANRSYNNDVFLTLFTESGGKMSVVTTYQKKGQTPPMRPFLTGEFVINTKNKTPRLVSSDVSDSHFKLMDDLDKLSYGNYLLELCRLTTFEHVVDKGHYQLITALVAALDSVSVTQLPLIRLMYLVKVAALSGHAPNLLPKCAVCGAEEEVLYFDLVQGQLFCSEHAHKASATRVKKNWLSLIAFVQTQPVEVLLKTKIHPGYMPPLIKLYEHFVMHHFQIHAIHSKTFIDTLL